MDALLAKKLSQDSTLYDAELYNNLAKLAKDYVQAGTTTLDYFTPDFDIVQDLLNCHAPLPKERKADFDKRDRNDPENFIHPMTATEMWTLATFVSQILFGGETTRKVEPRQPEDEPKAEVLNETLQWNDQQQDTYGQGFHWCLDSIAKNRGIMYDRWQDLWQVDLEPVRYRMPWEPPVDEKTGKPLKKDPETGKPIRKPSKFEGEEKIRFKKVRKKIGGFTKIETISGFDFISDPSMPPPRFQEGRFAGHRVVLSWSELKRRSELDPEDYEYVLPHVVEKLKNAQGKKMISATSASNIGTSRSYYERTRRQQPMVAVTGSDKINKEDGGIIECFCLQARLRPATFEIFEDTEEELIEFLIAGETDLLSVNVMTNKHDQYPYAIGEGRPSAHYQFSPGWALIIKGPQDYVDYLKNRHHESLARTSGNIFVGISEYIDFEAFLDPKKDGLMIPLTQAGVESGKAIDQIIKQIPVTDTTARFHEEMLLWQRTAEETTGAHAPIQGSETEGDPTATQFVGTQQMAQGRISTIARLLSARALVPQTQRIVMNLQQFLPPTMVIRITGTADFDPERPQEKFATVIRDRNLLETGLDENGDPAVDEDGAPIKRDPLLDKQDWRGEPLPDIQGLFDVVPHDGSLPGTDAKKVAAMTRALEVISTNPLLASVVDNTKPGAINIFALAQKLFKATGLPTAGLLVTRAEAEKNKQAAIAAAGPPPPPAPIVQQIMGGAPVPPMETPAGPIPGAEQVPPIPSAAPPAPNAGNTLGAAPV